VLHLNIVYKSSICRPSDSFILVADMNPRDLQSATTCSNYKTLSFGFGIEAFAATS